MKTVVVAGFGAFDDVVNNPSSAIAMALDECVLGDLRIVGREMPVSYARSVDVCEMWVHSNKATALVGIGVAMNRKNVTVERTGVRPCPSSREDIDGRGPPGFSSDAPDFVESSIDVPRLAQMLNADVGDDAGKYVCNAWLYQARLRLDVPVVFIHVPPLGLDSGRLLTAIGSIWG